jgi:LPS-assembly lipoprotein
LRINYLSDFLKVFPCFARQSGGGGIACLRGLLITLFAVAVLNGCSAGFKPRGADSLTQVPLSGLSVFIKANKQRPPFIKVLRRGLEKSGATLVTEAAAGVIELDITKLEEDKIVSAYSSERQVREFNHYIELDFTAKRTLAAQKPRQVSAVVRAERIQIYDSQYVLGADEEERTIRNELRTEVVRLLALRLGVLR